MTPDVAGDPGPLPSGVRLDVAACPLGCVHDDELVLTARDRLHGLPGRFRVVRCRRCGLMRTDPRPTAETIGAYYPDEYGPHRAVPETPGRRSGGRLIRVLGRLLATRSNDVPDLPPGRLLEVGCGSGAFLQDMASRGWTVRGVEVSQLAARRARESGIDVHVGTVAALEPPEAPYDLVAGFMVVEHLHNVVADLSRLREWVRPGGWLVVSTPNVRSLDYWLYRSHWYGLDVPRHLHHFNPRTLAAVLDRAGWKVEKVIFQRSAADTVASLGRVLEDRGGAGLAGPLLRFPESNARSRHLFAIVSLPLAALRLSSRMTVWARATT